VAVDRIVDEVKTVASVAGSAAGADAAPIASSATAIEALTTVPARRRSVAGSRAGTGTTVGLVSQL
jgi:hypothetical protein